TVVRRHGDALLAAAALVGHVDGAVRTHLDVTVQAAALREVPDRHRGTERQAAGDARGTLRESDVLRAVVDHMWIGSQRSDQPARRRRTAADRLVIDARGDAAALAGSPGDAIVVAVLHQ